MKYNNQLKHWILKQQYTTKDKKRNPKTTRYKRLIKDKVNSLTINRICQTDERIKKELVIDNEIRYIGKDWDNFLEYLIYTIKQNG